MHRFDWKVDSWLDCHLLLHLLAIYHILLLVLLALGVVALKALVMDRLHHAWWSEVTEWLLLWSLIVLLVDHLVVRLHLVLAVDILLHHIVLHLLCRWHLLLHVHGPLLHLLLLLAVIVHEYAIFILATLAKACHIP